MGLAIRPIVTGSAVHHTGSDGHLVAPTLDFESWDVPTFWPDGPDVPSDLHSMPPYMAGCAESSGLFFNVATAPAQSRAVNAGRVISAANNSASSTTPPRRHSHARHARGNAHHTAPCGIAAPAVSQAVGNVTDILTLLTATWYECSMAR